MFQKSDGSSVWLRSQDKLSYLSVAGVIDTNDDYAIVRPRLCQAYDLIAGIAAQDAFLVRELNDGALIFCAEPDKSCSLVILGKYGASDRRKPDNVVEDFFDLIQSSVVAIGSRAQARILINSIRPETAIRAS